VESGWYFENDAFLALRARGINQFGGAENLVGTAFRTRSRIPVQVQIKLFQATAAETMAVDACPFLHQFFAGVFPDLLAKKLPLLQEG